MGWRSRTGFQPVAPGILPAEGTGAGSPEDRLEACPTIMRLPIAASVCQVLPMPELAEAVATLGESALPRSDTPLYNDDLAPVPQSRRKWRLGSFAALWISMSA